MLKKGLSGGRKEEELLAGWACQRPWTTATAPTLSRGQWKIQVGPVKDRRERCKGKSVNPTYRNSWQFPKRHTADTSGPTCSTFMTRGRTKWWATHCDHPVQDSETSSETHAASTPTAVDVGASCSIRISNQREVVRERGLPRSRHDGKAKCLSRVPRWSRPRWISTSRKRGRVQQIVRVKQIPTLTSTFPLLLLV